MPRKNRELIDLWITIAIMISFSTYHLMLTFSEPLAGLFNAIGGFATVETVAHGMYVWMLGLLYIAYKRWRDVVKNESELTDIMASTGPAVVLVIEPGRKIRTCNGSIEHVFGYSPKEVLGKRTEFLYGDRRVDKSVPHEIYYTLEQVGFHIGEAVGYHKNGGQLFLEIITAEKKGAEGAVLLIKDITDRKKAEQAVMEAKEAAEKAYREKQKLVEELEENYTRLKELESTRDTLTHMIVHDMKTPLQVLSSNADLLEELAGGKLDEIEMKSLNDMRSYCMHLDVMMKSMLDISRMEDDKLPLNKQALDPRVTVEKSIRMLGSLKDNHRIHVTADNDLPKIEYDQELIERIFLNLFINAIKYSEARTQINAELHTAEAGITFSVSDEGRGIPARQLETVFKKFGQANEDGSRLKGSTGLGLTFCRLAVEGHGGQIGVQSVEGKGSTFWFTLPAASQPATTVPKHVRSRSVA